LQLAVKFGLVAQLATVQHPLPFVLSMQPAEPQSRKFVLQENAHWLLELHEPDAPLLTQSALLQQPFELRLAQLLLLQRVGVPELHAYAHWWFELHDTIVLRVVGQSVELQHALCEMQAMPHDLNPLLQVYVHVLVVVQNGVALATGLQSPL